MPAKNRSKSAGFAEAPARGTKRATNVSLNARLLEEARALNINISKAAERGLSLEIADARAKAWREENKVAIESWNEYVEQHGLPLARYRQF
jgi:antitoxin CcdA